MTLSRALPVALVAGVVLGLGAVALTGVPVAAFPTKPVTLIVPFKAGSAPDTTFRVLAELAEKDLGQKLVILNRPGPGGTIGVSEVIQSPPDGHTIGMAALAVVVLQPLFQDLPYKGADDLTLIAQANEAPTALAVNANAAWRTLDELLAEARKRPGQVSVGLGGGLRTILHVQLALLEKQAGVKFNAIPFEAGAQLPALLGGSIEAAIGQTVLFSPQVKAGKIRPLAQFGSKRQKGYEEVPTAKERGFDITILPYEFVIAPRGVPRPAAEKLTGVFKKAVESQAFREYADRRGLEVRYLAPAELAERLRADAKMLRQLVDELGWAKKK